MIFGFNTDVKHGETVYHVQSEAHVNTQQLLTTVFVQGRCIGKKASSYSEQLNFPGTTDEHIHEILKDQHRQVIEGIRAGNLNNVVSLVAN